MNMLIVGANGFIGQKIKDELSHYNIYGTYNKNYKGKDLIKYDILTDKIEDILNIVPKDSKQKIAIITTAIANIDTCFQKKELSYAINVLKMKELIKTLNQNDFKVIFLSTDFVFNGKDGNYTEDSQQSPITEYGKQKALIEQTIFDYSPSNVVIRLSKTVSNEEKEGNIF